MPGFWHVQMTMKGGRKKVMSVNHRSKRAAIKYADVEGAVDWKLFQSAVRLSEPRKS
jgi:hypothetical protein